MSEDTAMELATEPLEEVNEERDRLLERVLEALLMASDQPLSLEQLSRLLGNELGVGKRDLRDALARLGDRLADRAVELREVASGYRIQVRQDCAEWVSKLWQEKPPRLSRALLETLALICYRQPITRGEVEEVRGVALSPNIIRTLLERNWIREVGVKEVPGRPSLFGTTQQFLDDLSLSSLDDLPSLPEIKDPQQLEAALERLGEQLHEVSHIADVPAPGADADADQAKATQADATDTSPEESVDDQTATMIDIARDTTEAQSVAEAAADADVDVDAEKSVEGESDSTLSNDAATDGEFDIGADPDPDVFDPERS